MARRPRIDHPNGYHHVMNRGANRHRVFFEDCDRVAFGRLLGEIYERFEVACLAYCLMDNHYHLVLHCPHGNLSDAMKHLGGGYTQQTNERIGRDGPLFRGRFHSIPITSDAYLLCAVRYIHRNCLDLPGVSDVNDYRWSSHRTYLGHRLRPEWLDIDEVLGHFVTLDSFADFVEGEWSFAPMHSPDAVDIRSVVQLAIAVYDQAERGSNSIGLDRTIGHLLNADEQHPTLPSIASELPHPGSPAQRRALRLAKKRLETHPEVELMVTMVRQSLRRPAA